MMEDKYIFLIAVFVGILLVVFGKDIKNRCFTNFECSWKIVNCCPPEAGAGWECVDLKTFKEPKCPENILCPQFLSPKPEIECVCVDGSCVAK
jgi:hypothetical protein